MLNGPRPNKQWGTGAQVEMPPTPARHGPLWTVRPRSDAVSTNGTWLRNPGPHGRADTVVARTRRPSAGAVRRVPDGDRPHRADPQRAALPERVDRRPAGRGWHSGRGTADPAVLTAA